MDIEETVLHHPQSVEQGAVAAPGEEGPPFPAGPRASFSCLVPVTDQITFDSLDFHRTIMADNKHSALSTPSNPPPPTSHQNGRITSITPKSPTPSHHSPQSASSSGSPASSPAVRAPEDPWGPMTTTNSPQSTCRSVQQEDMEALLDLILECQSQRLEDQRASGSLLPDPGPAALCGACSSQQGSLPSLDFYYMLIQYQSDRMEDQRSSLPDLDEVVGLVPDQEDFFTLLHRVQSRRMDEQRASALLRHGDNATSVSSSSSTLRQ
ncbi:hypothetical protein LDENG_00170210 [Lucifuga dentata]|nr:hypothetical protein LDENG_00170210 [Lucifuga dentata]